MNDSFGQENPEFADTLYDAANELNLERAVKHPRAVPNDVPVSTIPSSGRLAILRSVVKGTNSRSTDQCVQTRMLRQFVQQLLSMGLFESALQFVLKNATERCGKEATFSMVLLSISFSQCAHSAAMCRYEMRELWFRASFAS
jgi:hypothetical protein